jgi:hypothetical protein
VRSLCTTDAGAGVNHAPNWAAPHAWRAAPIAYRHIDRMIEDNNKSRIHLGVHWDFDCKHGSESGARIAEAVYPHA